MDPIYHTLLNAGGMGVLAAVLLYLYVSSLKTFKHELKAERDMCHSDHEKIMDAIGRQTKSIYAVVKSINRHYRD